MTERIHLPKVSFFVALSKKTKRHSSLSRWPECNTHTALDLTDIKAEVSSLQCAKIFLKEHLIVSSSDAFLTKFKLNFSINVWLNIGQMTIRLLWHTMWAMIDDMFSSKFMFAPNLSNSCWLCASDVQSLHAFPGKKGSFLRSGPWAVKTDRLMLDSSFRENASLTLHWAMIAGAGERGEKHHPRLSRRYAPLTLQQMFRCGRPAAIHFLRSTARAAECTSVEEEQRREVEQHPCQPRIKDRVRIMTNLH